MTLNSLATTDLRVASQSESHTTLTDAGSFVDLEDSVNQWNVIATTIATAIAKRFSLKKRSDCHLLFIRHTRRKSIRKSISCWRVNTVSTSVTATTVTVTIFLREGETIEINILFRIFRLTYSTALIELDIDQRYERLVIQQVSDVRTRLVMHELRFRVSPKRARVQRDWIWTWRIENKQKNIRSKEKKEREGAAGKHKPNEEVVSPSIGRSASRRMSHTRSAAASSYGCVANSTMASDT